jgi:hypothetical protein
MVTPAACFSHRAMVALSNDCACINVGSSQAIKGSAYFFIKAALLLCKFK